MIILGEIQSYGKGRMKIGTSSGHVEVLFKQDGVQKGDQDRSQGEEYRLLEQTPVQFSLGDRIIMEAPEGAGKEIEYTGSIKMATTPFKLISEIRKERYCDVIALCSEHRTLVKTKGTDFLFSLVLLDQSGSIELKVFTDQGHYRSVVESNKGEPFKKGDILLVRNVKASGATTAVTTKPFSILKLGSVESPPVKGKEIGFVEWATVQFLVEFSGRGVSGLSPGSVSGSNIGPTPIKGGKIKKISEISDRSFFDIIGKVIHCDPTQGPTITITDFTESPLVGAGLSPFPCNMVLVIRLFGQHLVHLKKMRTGGYYLFENIRMHSFGDVLEAYMHDNLAGDVIPITDEEQISDLRQREVAFHELVSSQWGSKSANSQGGSKSANIQGGSKSANSQGGSKSANIQEATNQQNKPPQKKKKPPKIPENTPNNTEFSVPMATIDIITQEGLFQCICLIKKIEFQRSGETVLSFVTLENNGQEYRLQTRTGLHQMLLTKAMKLGKEYKCLVLRSKEAGIYLVEIFDEEQDYWAFLDFCRGDELS